MKCFELLPAQHFTRGPFPNHSHCAIDSSGDCSFPLKVLITSDLFILMSAECAKHFLGKGFFSAQFYTKRAVPKKFCALLAEFLCSIEIHS